MEEPGKVWLPTWDPKVKTFAPWTLQSSAVQLEVRSGWWSGRGVVCHQALPPRRTRPAWFTSCVSAHRSVGFTDPSGSFFTQKAAPVEPKVVKTNGDPDDSTVGMIWHVIYSSALLRFVNRMLQLFSSSCYHELVGRLPSGACGDTEVYTSPRLHNRCMFIPCSTKKSIV